MPKYKSLLDLVQTHLWGIGLLRDRKDLLLPVPQDSEKWTNSTSSGSDAHFVEVEVNNLRNMLEAAVQMGREEVLEATEKCAKKN